MADSERHRDSVEQITEIREAFERAESAGDSSVIDEYCTEDVVAFPPGQPPAVGGDACKQALDDLFAAFDLAVLT